MKIQLVCIALFLISKPSFCQDSLVTYSRILAIDSVSKNDLFDKVLIWCSKSFNDSKSATKVNERESGIIAGKAYFNSDYKVPRKRDSISGVLFTNFYFDWLIEVKHAKLKISFTNIIVSLSNGDYPVSTSSKSPVEVWLQPKSKTDLEWKIAKEYLNRNFDMLIGSLYFDLSSKSPDW